MQRGGRISVGQRGGTARPAGWRAVSTAEAHKRSAADPAAAIALAKPREARLHREGPPPMAAFPSLQSSAGRQRFQEEWRPRLEFLRDMFSGHEALTRRIIKDTLVQCGGDEERAAELLIERQLAQERPAEGSTFVAVASRHAPADAPPTPQVPQDCDDMAQVGASALPAAQDASAPRNGSSGSSGSSGSAAGLPAAEEHELYALHRRDALREGRRRDQLYRQASRAFAAGDRAAARRLATQGREAAAHAAALHAAAADRIFAAMNAARGPWCIDLHGLHAAEAVERLRQRVRLLRCAAALPAAAAARGEREWLTVVTGVGAHSSGGVAVVPAAVAAFVERCGARSRRATDGRVEVLVSSVQLER